MNQKIKVNLYVNPSATKHKNIIRNLENALKRKGRPACELMIIDAVKDSESVLKQQIFIIPTIIRVYPLPERRIIGDVSDPRRILKALSL